MALPLSKYSNVNILLFLTAFRGEKITNYKQKVMISWKRFIFRQLFEWEIPAVPPKHLPSHLLWGVRSCQDPQLIQPRHQQGPQPLPWVPGCGHFRGWRRPWPVYIWCQVDFVNLTWKKYISDLLHVIIKLFIWF